MRTEQLLPYKEGDAGYCLTSPVSMKFKKCLNVF